MSVVRCFEAVVPDLRLRLCGMQLVLQATIGDCLSFGPFAFEEDGLSPSEVDIGRREIVSYHFLQRLRLGGDPSHLVSVERSRRAPCRRQAAFCRPKGTLSPPIVHRGGDALRGDRVRPLRGFSGQPHGPQARQ